MKLLSRLIIIAALCVGLSACQTHQRATIPSGQLAQLEASGMQVIGQGSRLRIIIPTDTFFKVKSIQVLPGQEPALMNLAKLIARYKNAPIQVMGYTDDIGTLQDQYTRSLNQAEAIAAILWNDGVPLAHTSIKAMGASGRVASNATPEGAGANSRVEVWVN